MVADIRPADWLHHTLYMASDPIQTAPSRAEHNEDNASVSSGASSCEDEDDAKYEIWRNKLTNPRCLCHKPRATAEPEDSFWSDTPEAVRRREPLSHENQHVLARENIDYACLGPHRVCSVLQPIVSGVVHAAKLNASVQSDDSESAAKNLSTGTTVLSASAVSLASSDTTRGGSQEMALMLHVDARRRDIALPIEALGADAKAKRTQQQHRQAGFDEATIIGNAVLNTGSMQGFDPCFSQVVLLRFHATSSAATTPQPKATQNDTAAKAHNSADEIANKTTVENIGASPRSPVSPSTAPNAHQPDTASLARLDLWYKLGGVAHTALERAGRVGIHRRGMTWGPRLIPYCEDDVARTMQHSQADPRHGTDGNPAAIAVVRETIEAALAQPYGAQWWINVHVPLPPGDRIPGWANDAYGFPPCESAVVWPSALCSRDVLATLCSGTSLSSSHTDSSEAANDTDTGPNEDRGLQLSMCGLASPRLEGYTLSLPDGQTTLSAGPAGVDDMLVAALMTDAMHLVSRAVLADGRHAVAFVSSVAMVFHRSARQDQANLCGTIEQYRKQRQVDDIASGAATDAEAEYKPESMATIVHESMIIIWYVDCQGQYYRPACQLWKLRVRSHRQVEAFRDQLPMIRMCAGGSEVLRVSWACMLWPVSTTAHGKCEANRESRCRLRARGLCWTRAL